MEAVVVFGGAGFIGREVTVLLNKDENLFTVCADNKGIVPEDKTPAAAEVDLDVCSPNAIRKLLSVYKPDTIYWLPARQGYYADHSSFARVQIVGTYALFEAIDKLEGYQPERIVLSSSQAIYTPARRAYENAEKRPPSVYGLSKLQQERAFHWFCRHRGIICVGLRYSIVLGGGQALASTESGVIRNWWRAWKRDRRGEIYGTGEQMRDFVHVKDVARANVLATGVKISDNFNVAGDEMTINEAFGVWKDLTGCRDAKVLNKDVRPGGEYDMTSDRAYAGTLLDWHPKLSFRQMLEDFLESAKGSVHTS